MGCSKHVALPVSRQLLDRRLNEPPLRELGEIRNSAKLNLDMNDDPMAAGIWNEHPTRQGRTEQGPNLEQGDLMILGKVEELDAGPFGIPRVESPGSSRRVLGCQ